VHGGMAVGVVSRFGVGGRGVNNCGMMVVVGSGCVGGIFVGGRNGVDVAVGAQEVISHIQKKMDADTTFENLCVSTSIYDCSLL
jgi:hypothetical protein